MLKCVALWSKNLAFKFLVVQEDKSPRSTRMQTAQVRAWCSHRLLVSRLWLLSMYRTILLDTLRIQFVFWFVFFCLFSGPAHILCLTVASGWNKEGCVPRTLPYLCDDALCGVSGALPGRYHSSVGYFIWLTFSATRVHPRVIIGMRMNAFSLNLTFTAVTKIRKISVLTPIQYHGLFPLAAYANFCIFLIFMSEISGTLQPLGIDVCRVFYAVCTPPVLFFSWYRVSRKHDSLT
jgi:hypothetical protein